MHVTIEALIEPTKGGVSARGVQLGLTVRKKQPADAIERLERTAEAWCYGLEALGLLPAALDRRGIKWDAAGERITVEVSQPVTPD